MIKQIMKYKKNVFVTVVDDEYRIFICGVHWE